MSIILNGTTGITTPGITNTGPFVFQGTIELPAGTVTAPSLTTTGDTNTGIYFPAANQVAITTDGTQRVLVDGSGNFGLGVTPSAWSGATALQIGAQMSTAYIAGNAVIYNNAYYDGSNTKYIASSTASYYNQVSGSHIWATAASGTAGNTISFTQAMTLNSGGLLGIGTSSPSTDLTIGGTAAGGGAVGSLGVFLSRGATTNFYEAYDGTKSMIAGVDSGQDVIKIGAFSNHGVIFVTNNGERARIDSSGILGVGATPSPWGSSSNYKAVQLGGSQYSFFAGNQTTYVYGNAYWDGTNNKYINNGTACSFGVNVSGTYQFNIAASGTAGNNISFTEAVTISSSGNVGINKANPTYLLEMEGSAPRATIRGTTNGSNVGYRLDTKDSGGTQRYGGYYYQPQTGTNESYLGLSADDSGYQLGVKANGNVFLLGGATNATGTGITFPATQNASSNANCLDDYEEGSWTPTVGGNATYNFRKGQYTKVGNLVVAAFDMSIASIGTGSASAISGLPFTSAPSGAPQGIVAPASYWANLTTGIYWLAFRIDESQTTMSNQYTTGAQTTASVGGAILQDGARVIGTLTYYIS